jgi:DNA-binding transcriptional regulator YiaG
MTVRYHTRKGVQVPDYQCVRKNIQTAGEKCQVIQGAGVDAAISQLLLDTVTPLALEVALNVQAELEARADEADQLRRSHVERARQRAELARRRYLAVDPDNRLVADTLEADWNEALRGLQAAQEEYERQTAAANAALTEQHKQRIRQLASDFPKLWNDPATPARERKRIARLLIEDVTLTKTDQVHLQVRFRGGQTTSLTIAKALNSWQSRQTPREILAEIDRLLDDHTDRETAERLNQLGRRSGMKRSFTRAMIIKLRRTHDLPSHSERLRARGLLTQPEIAQRLGVHSNTIHAWRRAGLLRALKANDKNDYLYEPPKPGDTRARKHQGRRLSDRKPAPSTPGGAI